MQLSKGAIAVWCLAVGGALAFSPNAPTAFVGRASSVASPVVPITFHSTGCACPSCSSKTALFADVEAAEETETDADEDDVPAEIEAMDGVESDDEAHNVDRPARQQLKKKRAPKVKPLSEFEEGSTLTGKVKSIASYGAFVDIGADTDGLVHISQLASGFVENVGDVIKEGQEVEVRILAIDEGKKQISLSMMSEAEAASDQAAKQDRSSNQRQGNRRDDAAVVAGLKAGGFDTGTFVEGTVVSVVDFGAFVRVDASALNADVEGQMDGLLHISAMGTQRIESVSAVVSVDDKVQVRVRSIDGNKVSMTMLSVEEESAKMDARGPSKSAAVPEGAADWKEQLEKLQSEMPEFTNHAVVVDMRK